jgi:NADH:ubiquinone oxidoreductase subunit K
MAYYNDLATFVLSVALFSLLVGLFATAITKGIASILWSASSSMASVIVMVFFSYRNIDPQGNIFAICVMVFLICYVLLGASLCLAGKKDDGAIHFQSD